MQINLSEEEAAVLLRVIGEYACPALSYRQNETLESIKRRLVELRAAACQHMYARGRCIECFTTEPFKSPTGVPDGWRFWRD